MRERFFLRRFSDVRDSIVHKRSLLLQIVEQRALAGRIASAGLSPGMLAFQTLQRAAICAIITDARLIC